MSNFYKNTIIALSGLLILTIFIIYFKSKKSTDNISPLNNKSRIEYIDIVKAIEKKILKTDSISLKTYQDYKNYKLSMLKELHDSIVMTKRDSIRILKQMIDETN